MDLTKLFEIVGYVVVGLHALRGILALVKTVQNLIPGDQGEAFVEKIDGYISIIENFLGKLIPVATKKEEVK